MRNHLIKHEWQSALKRVDELCSFFEGKNFSYITRLRDAQFPNYEQIIPTSFSTEVVLKKSDFLQSIKRASIFKTILLNFLNIR